MIRVQLGVGFAALLFISYAAVEDQAKRLVERSAEDGAIARAHQALAVGQAEWLEGLERQRGLTRDAALRLADGPAAVGAALSRQLGGVRVFVLDRDRKVLAESGEAGSAPPGNLPGIDMVRPGTATVRIVAAEKILVVAAAGAPDGRIVATVRPLGANALTRWLRSAGEGILQLGLVGKQGKLQVYSGGDTAGELSGDGRFIAKDARFRYAKAEIYDDVGTTLELVGFGQIEGETSQHMAGLLRTTWLGLGLAGLAMLLVVVPVVGRLRSKERALEGYTPGEPSEIGLSEDLARDREDEDDASDPGWSEVGLAASGDVPGPLAEEPVTDLSRTLPPPSGQPLAETPEVPSTRPPPAQHASSERPLAAHDAALHAYLPPASTPPPGPMGAFESSRPAAAPAPAAPEESHVDPYAYGYAPEFASEIHPYQDPLRSEVTRGHGTSPPPRSVPAPAGPGSFISHGSGFSTGHTPPFAAASPITRAPNMRASYPAPGFEEVRPFDLEHYRVVYIEFVESKRRLGEEVDNVTLEGFTAKLRKSEQQLIDKHGCRAVRFEVLTRNRQVSLRPQLVR